MAQDHGEHVERRSIGMGESGDLPAEAGARDLHVFVKMLVAAGKLPGLVRHEHGRKAHARGLAKVLRNAGARGPRVEIACDDQHQVVRHVAGAVVGQQILAGAGGKDIAMTDDGLTVGMRAEGRLKQRLREPLVGIIQAHVDLAQDNFLLLRDLIGGQGRVQHGVGEEVDGHRGVLSRQIDVIDCAVEGRVGVDVATVRLHGGGYLPAGAAGGALEEHVLKVVRQARAEGPTLVDTAGLHPHLHRTDRCRRVALEQNGETVGEGVALQRFAPEILQQGKVVRAGRRFFGHEGGQDERILSSGASRAKRPAGLRRRPTPRHDNHAVPSEPRARRGRVGAKGFTNASSKS